VDRPRFAQPVLVNGAVGVVVAPRGQLSRVLTFTSAAGTIRPGVDVIADPVRLRELDLAVLSRLTRPPAEIPSRPFT
jgi:hypothetical protein